MKREENRKEIISNPRRNLLRAATLGAIGLANPLLSFAVGATEGNTNPYAQFETMKSLSFTVCGKGCRAVVWRR